MRASHIEPSANSRPDLSAAHGLQRWSERHALLMALAIAGMPLEISPVPAAALAAGSFLGLILGFRRHWTPEGRFGPANAITLARLLGVLVLLLGVGGGGAWPAGLALAILCADGLDGWAARRWRTASEFGHLFDQETDAFFVLVLCIVLYLQGQLGAWVLIPGALRYAFVLFVKAAGPPRRAIRGSRYSRAMGVFAILALTFCLLPAGKTCGGLAAAASLTLIGSFLRSAWRLYRPGEEA
jgi:phosphatidylglycerophosphate synthase